METLDFYSPCLFGMEGFAAREFRLMGAQNVRAENGRVLFFGDLNMLARANICSRYVERVGILLGTFKAETFQQLFEGVYALPFENWISKNDAFPVKGWSLKSQLSSVPDCQSIIKKAIVERLKQKYKVQWFKESGKIYQIQFTILKNEVSIIIDTSGEGLHKRGYRAKSLAAPIRETLAAAMARAAHVRGDSIVYDPFCGSGTILIEAAMLALNIAPGASRPFAAEKWDVISANIWHQERQRALDLIDFDAGFMEYGSDIDESSVSLTIENAKKAGLVRRIKVKKADISEFSPKTEKGIVICNPPYGERLLDIASAEKIYGLMGKVFAKRAGFGYYIISPHEDFEQIFGRRADKRRKLYNGMIKCQLYMYYK